MSIDKKIRSVGHHISVVLILFLLCSGCKVIAMDNTPPLKSAKDVTARINHEGIKRTYHIHLPSGFSKGKSFPLVLVLHGGGGTGRTFEQNLSQGSLKAAAKQRGVVLVFPEGINRQWSDGRPKNRRKKQTYDDVGFISKVIDRMVMDFGVDSHRVYATGISNGGFMSVRLAMDLSDKIAAIASVTAQVPVIFKERQPTRPISTMIINGTEDPIVPYDGGTVRIFKFGRSRGEILSTAESIELFRRRNACNPMPEKTILPDKDPNDGTRIEIEQYSGCQDKTEVTLVKVIGGGHTWPGGKQYFPPRLVGRASREINASNLIIDFFLNHSRK